MKKIILVVILGTLLYTPSNLFGETPAEAQKRCLKECNELYPGDTIFDGLQRSLCRLHCQIVRVIDELF